MKNQQTIKLLILLILTPIFFACATNQPQTKNQQNRPNIILIMADDLGYETIAANGGISYQTPNIDQLAAKGMRFEHCYAQPLCTPSRVKLMTGIYNVRNYIKFGILDESQTTFGHLFQKAGYKTCIVGKWQLGKDPMSPRKAGFEEHCLWQVTKGRTEGKDNSRDTRFSEPILETNGVLKTFDKSDYGPDIVSNYGLEFIERSVKKESPFLLYYPMILTHCPFSPTPDSPEWLKDDTTVMKYKGQGKYFEDMMAYTDKIIGNIQQKLLDLGIDDNTLIIFTGDNGTDEPIVSTITGREVAGAKGESTDAGTRVPFIVKWSKMIKPNTVATDLVDLSDVLPTICEAANIPIPQHPKIDGQSMFPQLCGKKGQPRQWIYNWYSRNGSVEKASVFARNHQYKLYLNGKFYEVPKDYLEKNALDISKLQGKAKKAYEMLNQVLGQYQYKRLDAITKN